MYIYIIDNKINKNQNQNTASVLSFIHATAKTNHMRIFVIQETHIYNHIAVQTLLLSTFVTITFLKVHSNVASNIHNNQNTTIAINIHINVLDIPIVNVNNKAINIKNNEEYNNNLIFHFSSLNFQAAYENKASVRVYIAYNNVI
jgi:hypothetical protein